MHLDSRAFVTSIRTIIIQVLVNNKCNALSTRLACTWDIMIYSIHRYASDIPVI